MCCGAWLGTRSGRLPPISLNEALRPPIPTRTVWSRMRQETWWVPKWLGLALCNHEPGLGGPNAAQSGAERGFTCIVCRACLLPAAASGLHRPNLSISTRHVLDNHFRKNARNSPLSEATKRCWKLGCQRRYPKKRDWDHMWT